LKPIKGKAITRIPNGITTGNNKFDFRTLLPTPGLKNSLPVYADKVHLSEISPHPASGSDNEFIELFNSGEIEVDLSDWQIDDGVGGSAPFTIPKGTNIAPSAYLLLGKSMTKVAFNDSGDSARLIDPNGEIKEEVVFGKGKKDESYARFGEVWEWTNQMTAGLPNQHSLAPPVIPEKGSGVIAVIPIRNITSLPEEEKIAIEGVVTAPPGTLSESYFYLQDDSGGIQIYSGKKEFPSLQSGDKLHVEGIWSFAYREPRVKVYNLSDIVVLGKNDLPSPIKIESLPVSEEYIGRYISVSGVKGVGDQILINGEPLKITFHFKVEKGRAKDSLGIAGIYSRYNDTMRILPFREADVIINRPVTSLPKSGSSGLSAFLIGSILFLLCELFLKTRKIQRPKPAGSLGLLRVAIFLCFLVILVAERPPSPRVLRKHWEYLPRL
ncbi:MAG TPA: lamin tail domain-containing protein, partial [bacterium]|nr:lamin tail domain-containing protein [bacterium]